MCYRTLCLLQYTWLVSLLPFAMMSFIIFHHSVTLWSCHKKPAAEVEESEPVPLVMCGWLWMVVASKDLLDDAIDCKWSHHKSISSIHTHSQRQNSTLCCLAWVIVGYCYGGLRPGYCRSFSLHSCHIGVWIGPRRLDQKVWTWLEVGTRLQDATGLESWKQREHNFPQKSKNTKKPKTATQEL